jgi:hypothetical protein
MNYLVVVLSVSLANFVGLEAMYASRDRTDILKDGAKKIDNIAIEKGLI